MQPLHSNPVAGQLKRRINAMDESPHVDKKQQHSFFMGRKQAVSVCLCFFLSIDPMPIHKSLQSTTPKDPLSQCPSAILLSLVTTLSLNQEPMPQASSHDSHSFPTSSDLYEVLPPLAAVYVSMMDGTGKTAALLLDHLPLPCSILMSPDKLT